MGTPRRRRTRPLQIAAGPEAPAARIRRERTWTYRPRARNAAPDRVIGPGSDRERIRSDRPRRRIIKPAFQLPNGHTADVVADALAAKIVELPEQLRRSITWDQGKEMAQHARFSVATGVPVYFCDPRSPWQRGSNENTNGLLRQYFPKRSDLQFHSQADLDAVAAELSGRPRGR
jgi:IS30 family transposase